MNGGLLYAQNVYLYWGDWCMESNSPISVYGMVLRMSSLIHTHDDHPHLHAHRNETSMRIPHIHIHTCTNIYHTHACACGTPCTFLPALISTLTLFVTLTLAWRGCLLPIHAHRPAVFNPVSTCGAGLTWDRVSNTAYSRLRRW